MSICPITGRGTSDRSVKVVGCRPDFPTDRIFPFVSICEEKFGGSSSSHFDPPGFTEDPCCDQLLW